ncbi:hypothetical protein [Ilumatobacter sp.]|uniref:hypothetical protein n=1 Tax=Ilumatobacter sp. TaxID=1967498 RepID=UPI003752636F
MAIQLGEQHAAGSPVVKRTALGQNFVGAVINVERRNRTKKDTATGIIGPLLKADGNPRQELVVKCLVMPGTDSPAGLGDEQGVPEAGETVRLILKGKSFADWIQAERALGRQLQVGDCVKQRTNSAQVYDSDGNPKGQLLTTQAELDAVPRQMTVGVYADLKLVAGEGEWVDKAEAAYRAESAIKLAATEQTQADANHVEEPW